MPEPRATSPASTLVTVVVPARNEEDFIGACLDSVLAQDERALQVVVVDGDSTDRTPEIVREYISKDPRVELLQNPGRIIPKALNLGLAAARGTWLVRVDAHSTIPPDYVGRLVKHLETGKWGGVGGRKDAVGISAAGKAAAVALESRFGVGDSHYHHATSPQLVDHVPFGAYPTQLARDLGGWDERLTVNEDYEFDYRVRRTGHSLLLDPSIRIMWNPRESVRALFRQYLRYGRGKAEMLVLNPSSAKPRHLAAPALVASWVVAAALAPHRCRLAALMVSPYVVALSAASVVTSHRLHHRRARWYLPASFLAMHAGWGIGFWQTVLRRCWRRLAALAGLPEVEESEDVVSVREEVVDRSPLNLDSPTDVA